VPATVIEADGAFVTDCDEAVVAEAALKRRAAEMGLQPRTEAAPPTRVTLDGAALTWIVGPVI